MKSKILFGNDARTKLLQGMNTMADAVSQTLGPKAKLVAIAKATPKGEVYSRTVIDDGVGVAKSIELSDEYENMGVAILREAAQKQLDVVGDGTTAVIVLAREIVNQSMKQIAEGKSPMSLRFELEESAQKLVKAIEKMAKPIKNKKDKVHIATISCKNEELGKLIAETFEKVGIDGVITVEESKSSQTTVDHQQGMQFDNGWYSPYFITDPNSMTATAENTTVLVTDHKIENILELKKFFDEDFVKVSRTITIIAPEFGGDALPTFIATKMDGKIQILCVRAPSFGPNQKNMLQDIAVLTGAKFITQDAGHKLVDLKSSDLGSATRITSTRDATIIVGGGGKAVDIATRAVMIKKLMETEESAFEQEKLKERLGKLSNGIAVIRVGGQTEVEMHERKERVEDAIASTRSAIANGIVPGGEVIYLKVRDQADSKIMSESLKKPFFQLLENSGIDNSEIMYDINAKDTTLGVDVLDSKVKDMIEAGIIDPASVSINAILNAVSVATQIILIGAIVVPDETLPRV